METQKSSERRNGLLPLIIWVAALVVISAGLLAMMKARWPGLHYDSVLYSTVAVNEAAGLGNVFDVYSPALIANPIRNFGQHGQLYPGLLSALFHTSNYERFFNAVYLINVLTALSFAVCLLYFGRKILELGRWSACVTSVIGTLAVVAVLLQIQGRPEHIIPLLVILGEAAVLKCRNIGAKTFVRGIELGAVASASPASGVVLASALLVLLLAESEKKPVVRHAATLFAFSAFSWAVLTKVFLAGSLWHLMTGAAQSDIDRRAFSEIFRVWLFSRDTPFIGLPFGFLAIFSLWRYWSLRNTLPAWKVLVMAVLVLNLAYWVFRSGIKNPPANYRVLGLFPAVVLGLLWLGGKTNFNLPGLNTIIARRFAVFAGVFALGLVSLGTVRAGALLWLHQRDGGSFQEARIEYENLKAGLQENERIGIDPWAATPLVVLDGPPWRMLTTSAKAEPADPAYVEEKLNIRFKYFLLTQDGWATVPPPTVNGFELEQSFFKPSTGRFWEMLLGQKASGYQFAVYRRIKTVN